MLPKDRHGQKDFRKNEGHCGLKRSFASAKKKTVQKKLTQLCNSSEDCFTVRFSLMWPIKKERTDRQTDGRTKRPFLFSSKASRQSGVNENCFVNSDNSRNNSFMMNYDFLMRAFSIYNHNLPLLLGSVRAYSSHVLPL